MPAEIAINYEALVAEYLQGLTTVLRGFSSATNHAFLETWVPDADEAHSILGILEAAHDAGLPRISLHLGPTTLGKVAIGELQELARRTGTATTQANGAGLDLTVVFATGAARTHTIAPASQRRTVTARRHRESQVAPVALNQFQPSRGVAYPLYAAGLRQLRSRAHAGELLPAAGTVLARGVQDGVTLTVLVEPSKHIVKKSAYFGATSDLQQALLEGLCCWLEGKPILECADHAGGALEFQLRDPAQPRPVPGIVTPENADPIFAAPTALIRGALADYRRQTDFRSIENKYDQPVTDVWRALTQSDRLQQIQAAIAQQPAGAGVQVMRLETPKRVVVGFTAALDGATKQRRLLQLEGHLKRTLEPTLQLYVEPKVDENKIRRLKEPATP